MIKIFQNVSFFKSQKIAQSLIEGFAVVTVRGNKMANAAALLRFKLLCTMGPIAKKVQNTKRGHSWF
jgi:hypothetical protein